jgi:hypothetical protein
VTAIARAFGFYLKLGEAEGPLKEEAERILYFINHVIYLYIYCAHAIREVLLSKFVNSEGYILILLELWWWVVKLFPRPIFKLQNSTTTLCQDSILSIF